MEDGVKLIFTRSRVDRRYWAALSKIETPKDLSTISERLGWGILICLTLLKVKILCLPEERYGSVSSVGKRSRKEPVINFIVRAIMEPATRGTCFRWA